MVHIQWKDRYNIGYKDIDEQHKRLLKVLNELIDLVDQGGDPDRVSGIFSRLCAYALEHFSTEERYMAAAGYPGLQRQQSEHAQFVDQLLSFNQSYNPSDPHLLDATLAFLKSWYLDHIIRSDMDYVPSLKRYHAEARIQAIVFDFGNVISRFDHQPFLQALSVACGKPSEELKALLFAPASPLLDYEAGRINSAQVLSQVSALCGHDFPEAYFVQAFTGIFTPIEEIGELIRRLKPNYKLGLISDTNPLHFEHAIRKAEVFPLFDSVTLSYELGTLKPDPRLFKDALDKLDLLAEECVFIDDRAAFAQAATAHLMHGITFTTSMDLIAQLRQHQVAC